MYTRAAREGVNWMFYRLAFSEQTRAHVEVHLARPTPHVYTDLVALDALAQIEELEEAKRKAASK